MGDWLREQWGRRHWGLNLILLFSAYMAFFYVPWDFLPSGHPKTAAAHKCRHVRLESLLLCQQHFTAIG